VAVRLAAALVLLSSAGPTAIDSTDRIARTVALPPGTPIQVSATIADVTITGSDRSDVSVEIVRHAPSPGELAKYPALVDERPDGLYVSAVQAGDGRDATLKTEIVIAAPATAVFRTIRVFEGHVKLTNLRASCNVDLRRGAVDATRLAGRIRLEAGIGSVDVNDSDLTPGGMMRLRVFNGPLRVRFERPPANARILAVTFNGQLTSDIPLTMKDKFGPRFGETTLGTGDPVMSLDVVKGDIAISSRQR
jgi:hypothetical protein